MASTSPLKVISPVIATSHLTGILVNEDKIERVIPIPADGPSFGVALQEMNCKSVFSKISLSILNLSDLDLTNDLAASTDSFITSPRDPVRIILPLPLKEIDSMVKSSPPNSVHARPVTWPMRFFLLARPYLTL